MAARKKLYVALAMAAWISIAALRAADYAGSDFGGFLTQLTGYSIPALLFGGILLWWFSRKPESQPPK
jgi:hypothetical protein